MATSVFCSTESRWGAIAVAVAVPVLVEIPVAEAVVHANSEVSGGIGGDFGPIVAEGFLPFDALYVKDYLQQPNEILLRPTSD